MPSKQQVHLLVIKAIGGAFVFVVVFLALFGVGSTPTVHAQEQPTRAPEVLPTEDPMQPPLSVPESSCTNCEANPYRVYVGIFNPQGTIEFNTQNNMITRTSLGSPVNPHIAAMMPNGKQVFMAGHGNGTVYGIDTTTFQITTTILTQGRDQRGLVISKDNTHLYVADNLRKQVIVIDLTTNKVLIKIPLQAHPEQIAISPDDSRVYVAANTPGTLIAIDTATNTVIQSIPTGSRLIGVYASRDGKKVFVSDSGLSEILAFDTSDFHQITSIAAGSHYFLFSNADGSKLYALSYGADIFVFDTKTFKFLKKIVIGDRQLAAALTQDGIHLYIGLLGRNIAVVNTVTDTLTKIIPVNGVPHAVAAMLPKPVNPNLLIQNGGFNGYSSNTAMVPRYWQAANFSSTDGKYTAAVQEGTASVKIDGASGVSKNLYQVLPIIGVAGDSYTFSYWVKGTAIPADANFCRGQVFVYNDSALVTAQTIDCPVHTYANFEKRTLTFTVPNDYNKVIVRFTYSKPIGRVWFDMVSLVKK